MNTNTDELLFNGQLIELKRRFYKIGRHADSHIHCSSNLVSRFACTLYKLDSGQWALIDGDLDKLDSKNKNGIHINGKLIDTTYGIILNHNDLVELSPNCRFQFFSVENQKISGKSSQELQDTFSDWRCG